MKYGSFSKDGRCYSISTPRTPSSWTNYLYNDNFMSSVNQVLQGDSKFVINYAQTTFTKGDRTFFLRDRTSGEHWKLNSAGAKEGYSCDHYLNKTVLNYEKNGIKASVRIFVPATDILEYWTVTLTNNSSKERSLSLFSSVGFPDSSPMGGTCVYEDGIIVKYSFPYHVYYHEKAKVEGKRAYFFMTSDTEPASCEMSDYRYFGGYLKDTTPVAVVNDTCSNIMAEVENFIGAMQHTFLLAPGESKSVSLVVGAACTKDEMAAVKAKLVPGFVEEEMKKSDARWEALTSTYKITTPNPEFDSLVNFWMKKQSSLLTRLNRMGTYCPVRNQFQDAMGYALIEPAEAIPYMMKLVARQQKNGYTKQWYMTDGSAPTKLCLVNHCDADVWLVLCITALVNQNGDLSIMDRVVPYIDGGEDTVYNHLLAAIEFMATDVGAHGLNLMHDGDWTDPINGIGRGGKGESTWTTVAMMYSIKQFRKICEAKGDEKAMARLDELWATYDKAVNENAWNGDRYIGGYDDDGVAFADTADNNRILLNAQTWAILAGAARGERLESVIKVIDSLKSTHGTYLLYPPFFEWDERWGRISIKKAGTTENGAVYCHATMFKAYSDAAIKDGNKLYESLLRTTPINPDNDVEKNRQLPLYVPNYYYSLEGSPNYGRSSCNYETGTVAWFLMAAVEQMTGVMATINGIRVEPNIPDDWNEASCYRVFKNAKYNVTVKRGAETTVNGKKFVGEYLPYEDGASYEVVWGI